MGGIGKDVGPAADQKVNSPTHLLRLRIAVPRFYLSKGDVVPAYRLRDHWQCCPFNRWAAETKRPTGGLLLTARLNPDMVKVVKKLL